MWNFLCVIIFCTLYLIVKNTVTYIKIFQFFTLNVLGREMNQEQRMLAALPSWCHLTNWHLIFMSLWWSKTRVSVHMHNVCNNIFYLPVHLKIKVNSQHGDVGLNLTAVDLFIQKFFWTGNYVCLFGFI